jgi:hypothetical protein
VQATAETAVCGQPKGLAVVSPYVPGNVQGVDDGEQSPGGAWNFLSYFLVDGGFEYFPKIAPGSELFKQENRGYRYRVFPVFAGKCLLFTRSKCRIE